jgi:hypothetical protein
MGGLSVSSAARWSVSFLILSSLIVVTVGLSAPGTFQSAILKTTCATLSAASTSVLAGVSGTILFSCGTNAALIIRQPNKYIPTFELPPGYSSLTIVTHTSGQSSCSPGQTLVSGARFEFNKPGNFDYCALFSSSAAKSLASFTLTWSNPGLGTQTS